MYDSFEHRFRDHDAIPTNLLVIKKTDGQSIGKVGINHNNPVCALHVVGGHTTGGMDDEALRVVGAGLFTSDNETALVVAMDTDNTANTSDAILKLKRDERASETNNVEEINFGFVGTASLYANQTSNAAYIQIEKGRNLEVATGATPAKRLEVSDTGVDVTGKIVSSGPVQVGSYNGSSNFPTASAGSMIFDSSNGTFKVFDGSTWNEQGPVASIYPIWAEESASMNDDATEWSFGNGDETPAAHGIPIGFRSKLLKVSVNVEITSSGTTTEDIEVEVYKNGVATGAKGIITSGLSASDSKKSQVTDVSVSNIVFQENDIINFKTLKDGNVTTRSRVCAWMQNY